jgi:hypothetical protein
MNPSVDHQLRRALRSAAGLVGASLLLAACSGSGGGDGGAAGGGIDGGSTTDGSRNDAPVASLRASASEGTEPLTVTFDASESRDPDGRIVSYLWRPWGRTGGSVENAQSSYGPVIYGEGEHVVELVVTDDRGARSSATLTVRVAPGPRGKLEGRALDEHGQPVPAVYRNPLNQRSSRRRRRRSSTARSQPKSSAPPSASGPGSGRALTRPATRWIATCSQLVASFALRGRRRRSTNPGLMGSWGSATAMGLVPYCLPR